MTRQPVSRALLAGVAGCLGFAAVSLALPDEQRWRGEQATLAFEPLPTEAPRPAAFATLWRNLTGDLAAEVAQRLEPLGVR